MRLPALSLMAALSFFLSPSSSFAQKKSDPSKLTVSSATTPSSPASGEGSARLPVRRVVLYKNGVGYFEHTTRVHGTQELNIDFTTAQLNDVLKSLTAVDLGEGRVSSVRYNSIAPLEERLRTLRLPFGEHVTQAEYLSALRGARVEVHSGSVTAQGRLLSVETVRRQRGKDAFEDVTAFSIVSDAGEMRNFELGAGTSVRIAERELTDEVGRYLSLIGSSRAKDVRRMSFTASGTGDREVFVSYISEVPIWKSTYRIIFPDKGKDKEKAEEKNIDKPLLQGWAIVDNTIGEDWKDVQLSLVAGAPQSFIQNISQPFYARRPVVELPESVMLTPQSQEATVEEDAKVQAPPPPSEPTGVGSGSGQGIAGGIFKRDKSANVAMNGRTFSQTVEVMAAAPMQSASDAMKKIQPEADGKSLGDFFEYSVKQKISIGKNQSALVPILQAHIEAEKVTLWSEGAVPLHSLWIKNTSGQILDAGSFSIVEAEAFAGEGVMEVIHPEERRLLSYAGDAAVHVKAKDESTETPIRQVRIAKGTMWFTQELRSAKRYAIYNADVEDRQVIVEYPVQQGFHFTAATPKPEETTESFARFRVAVSAGKTTELLVEAVQPQQNGYALTNLDNNEVELLVQQQRMTPAMKEAFDRILKQKEKVQAISLQISQRRHESEEITSDQNRLRENMKALKGTSEEKALLQRYVGQLDSQESRLGALRKEIGDLQAQENLERAELERMIMSVNLEESF